MSSQFECTKATPLVETKAGKIRGYKWNNTYTFQGIKYADAKRFQMPEEVKSWDGIKDAMTYGYVCPLLQQDVPNGEVMVPHRYWPMNENCQYLNIWSQSIDSNAKKPVMVWLHGGGFYAGSSIEQIAYDGTNLSEFGDVVVVSLNHRLNLLGYLNLAQYSDKYWNSGNVGNADIVAALRWIQKNIENFGGNPDNVTLFGQSGGGMKIWTLMQTREADGLYHKGIIQSGILEDFIEEKNTDSRPLVKAMLEELCMEEKDIENLETVPYSMLADAYNKVSQTVFCKGGYIGGHPIRNSYYKGDPLEIGFTEYAKKIPIIIGSVFAEMGFAPGITDKTEMSEAEIKMFLEIKFGDDTKKIISIFKRAYPDKSIADLMTYDIFFRKPVTDFVKNKVIHKEASIFSYLFAYEFPYDDGKPAWHCSDLAFVFHNTDKVPVSNIPGISDALEEKMCTAWVQFAKNGVPYIDDKISWPACEADKVWTMVFSNDYCEAKCNFDQELLAVIGRTDTASPFSVTQRRKMINRQENQKEKEIFLH